MMRNALFGCMMFVIVMASGCSLLRHESPAPEALLAGDLLTWRVVGIGGVSKAAEGEGYRLVEGPGSKGITLVSPCAYGKDVTLSFKMRSERREGVCVVFLSASDSTGKLDPPETDDGGLGFWSTGTVSDYMIAFHTAYHQPNLFINRNPGMTTLSRIPDPTGEEKWYDVRIARRGESVRVSVDGNIVLEGIDSNGGIPGGYIGLRLRGPGDGSYSCLMKDVVITEL